MKQEQQMPSTNEGKGTMSHAAFLRASDDYNQLALCVPKQAHGKVEAASFSRPLESLLDDWEASHYNGVCAASSKPLQRKTQPVRQHNHSKSSLYKDYCKRLADSQRGHASSTNTCSNVQAPSANQATYRVSSHYGIRLQQAPSGSVFVAASQQRQHGQHFSYGCRTSGNAGCVVSDLSYGLLGTAFRDKDLCWVNDIMSRLPLLDGIVYMPVPQSSLAYQLGTAWGFSPFCIALGCSYFQRLVATLPQMQQAARHHPAFAQYLRLASPSKLAIGGQPPATATKHSRNAQDDFLQLAVIQFTCIHLATKVMELTSRKDMLRHMLGKLCGKFVTLQQAYEVELGCLEGLKWRLGPYFLQAEHMAC